MTRLRTSSAGRARSGRPGSGRGPSGQRAARTTAGASSAPTSEASATRRPSLHQYTGLTPNGSRAATSRSRRESQIGGPEHPVQAAEEVLAVLLVAVDHDLAVGVGGERYGRSPPARHGARGGCRSPRSRWRSRTPSSEDERLVASVHVDDRQPHERQRRPGPMARTASPSGPRWRSAAVIRGPASAEAVPAGSRIAPMPHIAAIFAHCAERSCPPASAWLVAFP